ncbi:MAG: AmmeMemoRadiSam system protein B [Spirochaetaceae bacterium]|jgi:AmmeMemoRadiSam system protein B|uniref:AmmeMemoRadiSam system protein B n=2 Tax=Sphaerochaeta halotolerans TaxID=2293840 RepID=A0A372MJE4_9SPIR|nr:AmmeMemoRadiSam system protein B [Spirochaetaceae bacterium]RFU95889.1 AmmeMemoRadiSam system protein B [Sphaerochaeta halotolerans]
MMNMMRDAQYAGSWYPKDPDVLRLLVTESIEASKKRETYQKGPYRFAVLPHAGLFYSSAGIAPFFTSGLEGIEKILIISPSHYTNLPENLLVSAPLAGCRTPLGTVESFNLANTQSQWFSAIQSEHALEMVLPYIAAQNSSVKVSLAMISHFSDAEAIDNVARSLLDELGQGELEAGRTAIIASSDFTHYGPRFGYTPYGNRAGGMVKEDDLSLAHLLVEGRVAEAFAFCASKHSTVCGYAAALLVASIAQRMHCNGWVADYYTSLDVSSSNDANFVAYSTILWR